MRLTLEHISVLLCFTHMHTEAQTLGNTSGAEACFSGYGEEKAAGETGRDVIGKVWFCMGVICLQGPEKTQAWDDRLP